MSNKKTLILSVVAAVVVAGGGGFYVGSKYQQGKKIASGDFKNMTSEQRQQTAQRFGVASGVKQGNIAPGNFVNGEIIVKDDKSVTVKLRDGGSKIVFYSDKTEIGKFLEGAMDDLEIGKSINASGQANQDGSMNAQTIQIRPVTPITPQQ